MCVDLTFWHDFIRFKLCPTSSLCYFWEFKAHGSGDDSSSIIAHWSNHTNSGRPKRRPNLVSSFDFHYHLYHWYFPGLFGNFQVINTFSSHVGTCKGSFSNQVLMIHCYYLDNYAPDYTLLSTLINDIRKCFQHISLSVEIS